MFGPAEYDLPMRIRIPRPALFLALLVAPALLVATSHAQIHGAPASVTSPGFGGRAVNGPPPSVTSLGPLGYSPHPQVTFSTVPNLPHGNRSGDGHHHRNQGQYYGPVLYAYPYSYYPYYDEQSGPPPDSNDATDNAENNEANYEGGPTIFDR